jgi:hypothetical protein
VKAILKGWAPGRGKARGGFSRNSALVSRRSFGRVFALRALLASGPRHARCAPGDCGRSHAPDAECTHATAFEAPPSSSTVPKFVHRVDATFERRRLACSRTRLALHGTTSVTQECSWHRGLRDPRPLDACGPTATRHPQREGRTLRWEGRSGYTIQKHLNVRACESVAACRDVGPAEGQLVVAVVAERSALRLLAVSELARRRAS